MTQGQPLLQLSHVHFRHVDTHHNALDRALDHQMLQLSHVISDVDTSMALKLPDEAAVIFN